MECPYFGSECFSTCVFNWNGKCIRELCLKQKLGILSQEEKEIITDLRVGKVEEKSYIRCPIIKKECLREKCRFWSEEAKDCLEVLALLEEMNALPREKKQISANKKRESYGLPQKAS